MQVMCCFVVLVVALMLASCSPVGPSVVPFRRFRDGTDFTAVRRTASALVSVGESGHLEEARSPRCWHHSRVVVTKEDLPKYWEFMYPVLVAVQELGDSGSNRDIIRHVVDGIPDGEEASEIVYADGKSILEDRIAWGLSYCKLGLVLERPSRGLYFLSPLGREILELGEEVARERLREVDRQVRRDDAARRKAKTAADGVQDDEPQGTEEDDSWKPALLKRLHELSPEEFEKYVLAVLRAYGLSLDWTGGTGDEGLDGLGTAPISDVLSSTVAVQCKRYDPTSSTSTISRDAVALFQRDAAAKGAERAVMVTLGRFSGPAQNAARATTPTVDLIDGDRLCDLALEKEIGARLTVQVDDDWFERFTG